LAIETNANPAHAPEKHVFPPFFKFGTGVAEYLATPPNTTWGGPDMNHTDTTPASFWNTKLGQAAMASIAAMVMMIALSSQIQPGAANAAPLAHPATDGGVMVEIA